MSLEPRVFARVRGYLFDMPGVPVGPGLYVLPEVTAVRLEVVAGGSRMVRWATREE